MSVKPMRVDGVDISAWQDRTLNLAKAKESGLLWLYHKATEGTTVVDQNYEKRRREAGKAGLPFGAYHFARPDRGDARKEARFFLSVAKPQPGDLAPALDLETTEGLKPSELEAWVAVFVREVVKWTGVLPVVYGPFELDQATGCVIWRPRYNDTNTPPKLHWDIWQFSNGVYGVPDSFPGIGRADLNTMRKGLHLSDILIPKPKPPRPTHVVHLMHASLQFGDPDRQHTEDITVIFDRARERGVHGVTGTEAGPGAGNTAEELVRIGQEHGYRMWVPHAQPGPGNKTDCWLGVRDDFVTGGWETGYEPVIPGSSKLEGATRRWGPKGLVHASFQTEKLGRISLGVAHYLTGARRPEAVHGGVDHWAWNEKLARAIGDWALREGAGSDLVFYNGDQNMADNRNDEPQGDTFFGEPLTSAWDELEVWENTGHGNIDVSASYDRDGRVEAKYIRALDDKEFPLHTDHYLVEAGYTVKELKR